MGQAAWDSTEVYPACAGIDPGILSCCGYIDCLPRMRGDRPKIASDFSDMIEFTPHARGSTPVVVGEVKHTNVYPACAGIDQRRRAGGKGFRGLPRMRGDRPLT